MAEKFLGTLLLMFISSCYFIYNNVEKEFDIVIQMTLEHILDQGFKKKEMDKKYLTRLLTKTSRCYKVSKFLYNNDLAKSLF